MRSFGPDRTGVFVGVRKKGEKRAQATKNNGKIRNKPGKGQCWSSPNLFLVGLALPRKAHSKNLEKATNREKRHFNPKKKGI